MEGQASQEEPFAEIEAVDIVGALLQAFFNNYSVTCWYPFGYVYRSCE